MALDGLSLRGAEPLGVELLIGAVLTKRDQYTVNFLPQGAVQLHFDGDLQAVKFRTDHLYPSLSLMRCIVKEQRCGRDYGIYLLVQEGTEHLVSTRKLLYLCVSLPKIISRNRGAYRGDLFARQIARSLR